MGLQVTGSNRIEAGGASGKKKAKEEGGKGREMRKKRGRVGERRVQVLLEDRTKDLQHHL